MKEFVKNFIYGIVNFISGLFFFVSLEMARRLASLLIFFAIIGIVKWFWESLT